MTKKTVHHVKYNFFEAKAEEAKSELGKEGLKEVLKEMLMIRHFEMRAESAYQQGKLVVFSCLYGARSDPNRSCSCYGRENNWWITTYRCHALALLNGATPNEMMAELYGKVTGNALGRGGSMHFLWREDA